MLTADLLFGLTPPMARVRRQAERAAQHTKPFLIRGESGTGKTLLARFIHGLSARANAAFIATSAFGISESLAQSALGGHRRGAFTGAIESQTGLLAAANRGTLFLDEIGDASIQLQGLLLEFLDHGTARQVGDVRSAPVDVRLIGATNAPIEDRIAADRFRSDLWFRFGYFGVTLSPLCERRRDIPALSTYFLEQCTVKDRERRNLVLTPAAMTLLSSAPWPSNIRGLKNALEYAAYETEDDVIDVEHLPEELSQATGQQQRRCPEDRQEEALACLASTHGNLTRAAQRFGVSRQHFYRILGDAARRATGTDQVSRRRRQET